MTEKKITLAELDDHYHEIKHLVGNNEYRYNGKRVYGVRGTPDNLEQAVYDLSVHTIPDEVGITYFIPVPAER